ncbi:MAG: hypothetical protein JWQ43_124, partial [Glaciihabitans sp.]|nr:hypothetical protein [Glaciihabitans sp.]
MIRAVLPAVASVGILAASVLVATPAWAAENDSPDVTAGNPVTRAEGFFTPLSLEIDRGQTAYLSQNFIGQLTRVARDGTVTSVASAPEGYEIGAVSSRKGVLYYYEGVQAQGIGTLKKLPEG